MRGDSLSYSNITSIKIDSVTDAMREELKTYSSQTFVRGFQREIFRFYYKAAQIEKKRGLKIKRFLKSRDYYRQNIENMTNIGSIGKLIFETPALVGIIMFKFFGLLI